MTVPYSLRQQGWMEMFQPDGPAITETQARAANLPLAYARDVLVEVDTLHCKHCGGVVIKNPDRVRPRGHCTKCNWYVCDGCDYLMSLPDYVHETFFGKVERLKTARANLTCV